MATLLSGCEQGMEGASFNVYFKFPQGGEVYLGRTVGLENCRLAAQAKASQFHIEKKKWKYTCCLRTKASECAEKIQ